MRQVIRITPAIPAVLLLAGCAPWLRPVAVPLASRSCAEQVVEREFATRHDAVERSPSLFRGRYYARVSSTTLLYSYDIVRLSTNVDSFFVAGQTIDVQYSQHYGRWEESVPPSSFVRHTLWKVNDECGSATPSTEG